MSLLAEIMTAVASLLWPLVVVVVLIFLLPVFKRFLSQSDSIDVEVVGARISMQRASEELRKQINDLQDRVNELEATQNIGAADPPVVPDPSVPSNTVLWVDDHLENNLYERARLAEAGRRIVQADSTRSAMERLRDGGPYGVIVSDMSREENGRLNIYAGLDLLEQVRNAGSDTPIVFYSSPGGLSSVREELERADNVRYTASPSELMRFLNVHSDN
ncbi:hypothetical protein ACIA5D_42435 [Actinoplanes sp. NPDC051513]|uniref:hypothetical protein n=1 Tax=Actinoplanes sp. NPDC051513 TaxID=3363908 RepID=UPI0037B246BC